MTGMMLGPVPSYVDYEVFYPTLYTLWNMYAPKKSGFMADSTDYEYYADGSAYFWNSECVYFNYQDEVTRYTGFFHDELPRRYKWLLDNWSSINEEDYNEE